MGCSSKEQTGEREGIIYNPLSFVEHLYPFLVLILGLFRYRAAIISRHVPREILIPCAGSVERSETLRSVQ